MLTCQKCGADAVAARKDGVWVTIRSCSCAAPLAGSMQATVVAVGGMRG